MNRISSASASKKGAPKKHGKLRSMSILPAENGVTSQMQYEAHPDAKGEEQYGDHLNPKPTIHTKMKHLIDHVKENTASFFPQAGGASADSAAAPVPAGKGAPAAAAEPDEDDEEE
jgi:hypothetical protein